MTAKEKAEELVNKLKPLCGGYIGESVNRQFSKQSALIIVDEIIDALEKYDTITEKSIQKDCPNFYSSQLQNMDADFRFWNEVKNEIVKL